MGSRAVPAGVQAKRRALLLVESSQLQQYVARLVLGNAGAKEDDEPPRHACGLPLRCGVLRHCCCHSHTILLQSHACGLCRPRTRIHLHRDILPTQRRLTQYYVLKAVSSTPRTLPTPQLSTYQAEHCRRLRIGYFASLDLAREFSRQMRYVYDFSAARVNACHPSALSCV